MTQVEFARKVRWLRQLPGKIVRKLPILSDYYYYYWYFPRQLTAYRGVFSTFSEALAAIPANFRSGFNQAIIHNYSVGQVTACCEPGDFNPSDYPVLFWLASAFNNSSTVFDLGGSVGLSYYSYRKYIPYPDNLSWIVCDVPEVVKAGEKLAGETSPGLSYTVEFAKAEMTDILLTCGTLQYLEPSLAQLLEQLKVKPRHILINRVPFYDGESYFTLQNIEYALTPYKIQNRTQFITSLDSLGYELIDSWHNDRTCFIPFHPERFVNGYHGFYFRLKHNISDHQPTTEVSK